MPHRRLRRALALLAAAQFTLVLAACTGNAPPSAQHTGGSPSSAPSGGPTGGTGTDGTTSAPGVSPLGAKWDKSRVSAFGPYLESLRGTTTFTELVWCDVESQQGQRNWRQIDDLAKVAQQHGISLDIKIRVGACWATGGQAQHVRGVRNKTESAMPTDLGQYRSFVRDVVDRYKTMGVHTYAVENEVNSPSFWSGTPEQLTALTEAAASEIRSADPTAKVADAGMSSTSYGYGIADQLLSQGKDDAAVQAWNTYYANRIGTRGEQIPQVGSADQLRTVLASDQGRRNLAYLAVATSLAQRGVTDIRQVHFYEPWSAAPLLTGYLASHTPSGHPIEAWEVGSFWKNANGSEQERTDDMTRTVSLLLAGDIRRVIWLPLATSADNSGSATGQEARYGLLDPDGTIRSAGVTMRDLVAASRGARISPVVRGALRGVAFTSGSQSTLVLWSTGGDQQVSVGHGATAGPSGAAAAPVSSGTVTVHGSPVIVTTRQPLASVLASA
ncbi:hypothetical protein [Oryzihumus sp.]